MKTIIGGAIAAVIGLIGITAWFDDFVDLLKGSIPVMLLLGGALALYLGFDELKDSWKKDEGTTEPFTSPLAGENEEKYKREIDELKKEVEDLKKKGQTEEPTS